MEICHFLLISFLIQQLGWPLNEELLDGRGYSESRVHGYYNYAHFAEKQLMLREEKQ